MGRKWKTTEIICYYDGWNPLITPIFIQYEYTCMQSMRQIVQLVLQIMVTILESLEFLFIWSLAGQICTTVVPNWINAANSSHECIHKVLSPFSLICQHQRATIRQAQHEIKPFLQTGPINLCHNLYVHHFIFLIFKTRFWLPRSITTRQFTLTLTYLG